MAKYIKQEMPDIRQTGEQKVYYRLQTTRNIGLSEFAQRVSKNYPEVKEGEVIRVLRNVAEEMAELIGNGYSITFDNIGIFKGTIGMSKKKKQSLQNSDNLELIGINYRADKNMIKKAQKNCKLVHAGESRINQSPYTREERLQLALEYLNKKGAMRISDYLQLTGMARTSATIELQEFREDPKSGIGYIGKGSSKVYVKKEIPTDTEA